MSLAGVEDLEAAEAFGDLVEALGVVEHQAGALVGGDAAREAEGEDGLVEDLAGALLDDFHQTALAQPVGVGDTRGLDAVDGTEVLVIVAPARDFLVEDFLERLSRPGGGVHAIGYRFDLVVGEHLFRHLAVLHGDAVDPAREAQGDVGHVEQAIMNAAEALERLCALLAEHGVHLVQAELVVAGGNRGVGGEDALPGDGEAVVFCGFAERGAGFEAAFYLILQETESEQGGVAFVHVVDSRQAAHLVQQLHAGEAEDGLLAKAIVGVAAIKMVGKMAVPGVVAFDVGVKQEDRNDVAMDANDVEAPGADFDLAVLHGEGDGFAGGGELVLWGPGDVGFGLLALGVKVLAEVAAAMGERDGDHGGAGVGGGAQGVAGEHAETARVGGEFGRKGDFHRKVGDGPGGEVEGSGGGLDAIGHGLGIFPRVPDVRDGPRTSKPGFKVSGGHGGGDGLFGGVRFRVRGICGIAG